MTTAQPVPPTFRYLLVEFDPPAGVVTVILNRPEVRNALSADMLAELLAALDWVEVSGARALVLRGAGRGFCAGADLAAYLAVVDVGDPASVDAHLALWNGVARRLRTLSVPSIAAVHGAAYGGGLNVALACDLVMLARSARLCEPYVNIGATADVGVTYLLPRLIGAARARRMILLGEVMEAPEAHRIGLAAYLVEDDELIAAAADLGSQLAAKDPEAVRANRELLDAVDGSTLEDTFAREGAANQRRVSSPAFAAATAGFGR